MKLIKTKISLTVLLLSIGLTSVWAQQTALASGGTAAGSGGTVDYSVGQTVYTVDASSSGTLSMGVQQPFETSTLGKSNFPEISVAIMVYPNPTTSLVNLNIGSLDHKTLQYQLLDLNGREIFNGKIKQLETQIQFGKLPAAVYFLNVVDKNKKIKVFKIIKK